MIIIGSKALLPHMPKSIDVLDRMEKSDYDVVMSFDEFVKWSNYYSEFIHSCTPTNESKFKVIVYTLDKQRKMYEIEIGMNGNSAQYLLDNRQKVCSETMTGGFLGEEYHTLSLEYQYMTKKSHIIYPVHFEKNINDYHWLKRILGENAVITDQEYFDLRSNEAKNRYNTKTPKLNVTTEDFFSSKLNVPNYFVHDDIHEIMAHHDKPVFRMMQKDDSKAWCEKDMFFNLPYEYQVQAVQEEAYVIALERYVIPQYGDDCNEYYHCYKKAVKRICTTLTSGWFREFAIENYLAVLDRYDHKYVMKFVDAVSNGRVSPKEEYINLVPLINSLKTN